MFFVANKIGFMKKHVMWFCDNSVVRCLQVSGVINGHAIFYLKKNLINLLFSGSLFVHNHERVYSVQFCKTYHFLQRMNKINHIRVVSRTGFSGRVRAGFRLGSGLKLIKISGLIRA